MAFWTKELGDRSHLYIHDLPDNSLNQHLDVNWLPSPTELQNHLLSSPKWTAPDRIRWIGSGVNDKSSAAWKASSLGYRLGGIHKTSRLKPWRRQTVGIWHQRGPSSVCLWPWKVVHVVYQIKLNPLFTLSRSTSMACTAYCRSRKTC